ncbi:MAG: HNH endonuclease [Terracidiphilus sp.]|jgi:hypothetical protein
MSEPVFKLSRLRSAPVSDEELIADLRRVAELLETETMSQDQYKLQGHFSITTYRNRFGNWNNALLKSGIEVSNETDIPDEKLIADLRRVAGLLGTERITREQYELHGKYSGGVQSNRFGTWNKALLRAGLKISHRNDIPDIDLFENILTLWQHYGRQPRRDELAFAPSHISQSPYNLRFGSWMNTLKAFVDYANRADAESVENTIEEATGIPINNTTENVIDKTTENLVIGKTERSKDKPIVSKRGPRYPGRMLIMQVLIRDQGICQYCKRAATADNLNYHIDHIIPWIKAGPTILSNLQLLCSRCNLIKGDLDLTNCIGSSS